MVDIPMFPLDDCHTCGHRRVCKYIFVMSKIRQANSLPIDFDLAVCREYIDDIPEDNDSMDDLEGMEELSYDGTGALYPIITEVVRRIAEKGGMPFTIKMNANTMQILIAELSSMSPPIVCKVKDGMLSMLTVLSSVLDVVLEAKLPDDQFFIEFDYGMGGREE